MPGGWETASVEWQDAPGSVRAAVERALTRHQRDALAEVEQILDAALRVAERVAPADPKVADIVAEAGTSNQTFYRYFAGKNDLMVAVLERGVVRVRAYLQHRMAKYDDPAAQVAAWADGLLRQLSHPPVARQSMAVSRQADLARRDGGGVPVQDQLGDLLIEPLTRVGRPEPVLDARALQDVVMGTLQRHVRQQTSLSDLERAHLVGFCVAAVFPAGEGGVLATVPGSPAQATTDQSTTDQSTTDQSTTDQSTTAQSTTAHAAENAILEENG